MLSHLENIFPFSSSEDLLALTHSLFFIFAIPCGGAANHHRQDHGHDFLKSFLLSLINHKSLPFACLALEFFLRL